MNTVQEVMGKFVLTNAEVIFLVGIMNKVIRKLRGFNNNIIDWFLPLLKMLNFTRVGLWNY